MLVAYVLEQTMNPVLIGLAIAASLLCGVFTGRAMARLHPNDETTVAIIWFGVGILFAAVIVPVWGVVQFGRLLCYRLN